MLKKIAVLIFATVFFVGSVHANLQTDVVENDNGDVKTAAEVISAIGIYSPETSDDGLKRPVTRGEFIDAVMKLAYPNLKNNSHEVAFADVDNEHPYFDSICLAKNIGLVGGITYNRFYPDDSINYTHALAVMVRILGYEPMGGFEVAWDIGLTKGFIKIENQELSVWNCILLLYNALEINLMQSNYDGSYKISDGINLLNSSLKLDVVKGIVNANEYTYLYTGEKSLPVDNVEIDDNRFSTEIENIAEYIGMSVTAYCTNNSSDTQQIIYIRKNSSMEIEKFYYESITGFQNNSYTIENENGKTTSYPISSESAVIYNKVADSISKGMIPKDGYVELIDNNSDGLYDVVKITEYNTYFVKSIYYEDHFILTQNGSLYLENDAEYYLDGKKISFSGIKESHIISVEKSRNDKGKIYNAIYVSSRTISGNVTETDEDSLVIDGSTYQFIPDLQINVGNNGIFYLDYIGRVSYFQATALKDETYGYLMKIAEEKGLEGIVKAKILTHSGSISMFTLRKKAVLDGVSKYSWEICDILKDKPQLIRYKLNDEGEIIFLDTKDDGGNLKEVEYDGTAAQFMYRARSTAFGESKTSSGASVVGTLKYFVDSQTKVFFVSNDLTKEKLFETKGITSLVNEADYYVKAYDSNGIGPCGAVVINVDSDSQYLYRYNLLFYISSVALAINEDGEQIYILKGLHNYTQAEYIVDPERFPDVDKISSGDIIQISVNDRNEITIIKFVYKMTGSVPSSIPLSAIYITPESGIQGTITDTMLLVMGKITRREGNVIEIEYQKDGSYKKGLFDTAAGLYIIYDKGKYIIADSKDIPFSTEQNQLSISHIRSGGTVETVLINR